MHESSTDRPTDMIDTDYPERAALAPLVGEIFKLVVRGATDEQWAEWLRVPLEHAAADGNIELFNALIGAGADGSAGWRGCHGRTLFHAAARGGNAEVVSGLVAAGAQPDVNVVLPSNERSALYLATSLGYEDAARRLVMAGADVHFPVNSRDPDDYRCDILVTAITKGFEQLVNDLLIGGAAPNNREMKTSPLHTAAEYGFDGIVSKLLVRGADKDARGGHSGETPLMKAVRGGYLPVVNTLLAAGAYVHIRDSHGCTAFTWAARYGHVGILKVFLGLGVDVNAIYSSSEYPGRSALHFAANDGQAGAIDVLVEAGARIELKDFAGRTPLCFAANNTGCEAMHALLRHGANPRVRDEEGNTPLHLACRSPSSALASTVDLLLRAGADETAVNNDGETPAQILESPPRLSGGYQEEVGRARRLLARAPNDRAWRRRCWLVMLGSRTSRARKAGCNIRGVSGHGSNFADTRGGDSRRFKMARSESAGQAGTGCAIGSGGEDGGLGAVVASLIGLGREDVFRTIVGFL